MPCDFTDACNDHDICYATCNKGKENCDKDLLAAMRGVCDRELSWLTPLAKSRCYGLARLYWSAVNYFGDDPYEEAQDMACEWEECCEEE